MPITLRTNKGTPLTTAELDGNFTDLDGKATTGASNLAAHSASGAAHGIPALQSAIAAFDVRITAASLVTVPFSLTPQLNAQSDMGVFGLTANATFTANLTGAIRNGYCQTTLVPNGFTATFNGFHKDDTSGDFDVTRPNDVYFTYNGTGNPSVLIFPRGVASAPPPVPPPPAGSAPVFTAPATIDGTPTVGSAISFTSTITGQTSVAIQWTLDNAVIVGATSGTYTPISSDATHALRVVVTATNANGSTVSTSAPVTVVAAAGSAVITGTAPAGTVGTAYTYTFTTTGFVGAITASLTSGTLPAGLALSVSGTNIILSGTPTTAAAYTFVVHGVGATSGTADSASQSVTVAASGATAVRFNTVSNATQFAESGGTPYYTYTGVSPINLDQQGVSVLAMAGDGWFQADASSVSSGIAVLAVSTTITNNAFANWIYAVAQGGGYDAFSNGTAHGTGTGAGTAITARPYRIRRAGTTLFAETDIATPGTFVAFDTLTGVSGTLYLHGTATAGGSLVSLQGSGVA